MSVSATPRPVPDVEVAARVAVTVRADVRATEAYPVPRSKGLIELHANENPWPLPPRLRGEIAAAVAEAPIHRYPDGAADAVKAALRRTLPIPPGAAIAVGSGSDELIQIVTTAIARPGATMLAPEPTFVMYRIYAELAHVRCAGVALRPDFSIDEPSLLAAIDRERPALVWLASPNNPTGRVVPPAIIERVLARAPGLVVVDEAYADFAGVSLLPRALDFPNLLVLRTLSKVGLAGVRLGYAVGHPAWIGELDKVRSPYNVNSLTQAVVPVVLAAADVLAAQVASILRERERLARALGDLPGATVFPSDANFLVVRVADAPAMAAALRGRGILVKNLHGGHPLTANCLRITVGTPAENDALLAALRATP